MPISELRKGLAVAIATLAVAGYVTAAQAFDPKTDLREGTSASDAYAFADQALRQGNERDALAALEFAARKGHAGAQWKLAKMYAEGRGVKRDDLKAFEHFRELANQHADDNPLLSSARIVSESFVELASYYLSGIPDTRIVKNLDEARNLLTHAATYFGDPEAQYQLGEMYLEGRGVTQNDERAANWFLLAAKKQHVDALGKLGQLLYSGGKQLRARPLQGLKFLEVARRVAGPGNYPWIKEAHEQAFFASTEEQRRKAMSLADGWMSQYGKEQR